MTTATTSEDMQWHPMMLEEVEPLHDQSDEGFCADCVLTMLRGNSRCTSCSSHIDTSTCDPKFLGLRSTVKDGHMHPMVLKEVEQLNNQSEEVFCSVCWRPMVGENYWCTLCSSGMHKTCGEWPEEFSGHPFHHDHLISFTSHTFRNETCGLCESIIHTAQILHYECLREGCGDKFHVDCVMYSLSLALGDHSGAKLKHDAYPLHPLALFPNHTKQLSYIKCICCHKPLFDSIYVSDDFKLFLHQTCLELFTGICIHPFHRDHPLILDSYDQNPMLCKICQEEHRGLFYRCSLCNFHINVACAWPDPIIKNEACHEHPFHLFWKQDHFICDACGIEGRYCSYACFICHYQVHPVCTSVPRMIKVTRHISHRLSHNYFVPKQELIQRRVCRFCFQEVKTRHGCYYCSKPDCDYIAHVNCALEDKLLYDIVDPDDPFDEDSETIESSITCILEENGIAVKVKHCFHEHILTLGDTGVNGEKDDKYCDGCMQLISGPFYSCSDYCDFLLHKSCAELPRKRNHFYHKHYDKLDSIGVFRCPTCSRLCSGFIYLCIVCRSAMCLNCANLSDTITYPDHEHLLFADAKNERKCNCCGVTGNGYRCTENCNYALDKICLTLPREVRHKCDTHLLKLTATDGNDDPRQCYCDICEEQRDPDDWFYHCSDCDTSAHRDCALGKYPFIKIGSRFSEAKSGHDHPLTFVQKTYYYPECDKCHKPCQDLSVECATCNYLVHWECLIENKEDDQE